MALKLFSAEDVGEGEDNFKNPPGPTASAPRCLLDPLRRRLFRNFQGVNHKCGPVLFGSIEPSALDHFTPFWDLKNLDTVIGVPPALSRTTSPTLNSIAPSPNYSKGRRIISALLPLAPTVIKNHFAIAAALRQTPLESTNPTGKIAMRRSTSARFRFGARGAF